MKKRIWRQAEKLADTLETQLLKSRGLNTPEEIEAFLNPRFEQSYDPFLLSGMSEAVTRVRQALESGEQITVYADYDADAVTAAATLLRYFQKIGYSKVNYYIPDRDAEGYGINTDAVKTLAAAGTKLLLTVDCGINAFDAIDLATFLGVDVVVTDHHLPSATLPRAAAVVNPHRSDDKYPFKDLTGVGVAFKLVQALVRSGVTRGNSWVEGWEKWLLDLVAIGTVADCQSLLSENRIFVKWGLLVLEKTRWPGLAALIRSAELQASPFTAYHVGFVIAPRINAAGRIEHANLALELLLTDDEGVADGLAQKLEALNQHRRQLTDTVLSEAREQIALDTTRKIFLAAGDNWPKGVVGLVAGKLTEEFFRPVLVLEKGAEEATGSARSIAGFNIVEAIAQSKDILLRYGGHAQAAGFTLRTDQIQQFHKNLLDYAEAALTEEDLSPVLRYEVEIGLSEVTSVFLDFLEKLEPYGQGNPRPRFRINGLEARFPQAIGAEGRHLRFYTGGFACIGFNLGFWSHKLNAGQRIDIICEPQWNEWNGQKKIQLRIIDLDNSK